MPRKRWIIALAALVVLLAAAEVIVRRWERPKVSVVVMNESDGDVEGVMVTYGGTRTIVESIRKGQSSLVRVTTGPPGPLRVEYQGKGKGKATRSVEVADFDPAALASDGSRQVVVIVGPGQERQFVEEDHGGDDRTTFRQMLRHWLGPEVGQVPP